MSLLVESIRIENRELQLIDLHNERFNRSRKALFGTKKLLDLREHIALPDTLESGPYKCRLTTDGNRIQYTIDAYNQRKVQSLKLVAMNDIVYTHKTDAREKLDLAFSLRGNCDDVIILKDGLLSDSWAANILLFDGKDWFTPDLPLLKGVQRAHLLQTGKIRERRIAYNDLAMYKSIKLINAMIGFERADSVNVKNCIR